MHSVGRAQADAPRYLGVNDPGCFVTEASAHARNPRMRYPPIAEHGVIGDLHTVALVAVDGTIDWYCCPSFDSPSVFAALLDADRGGFFRIAPVEIVSSQATMLRRIVSGADRERRSDHKQLYFPDTNVLITRFLDADGVCEVQDFMPIQAGPADWQRHRLIRRVLGVRGRFACGWSASRAFDYGREAARDGPRRARRDVFTARR